MSLPEHNSTDARDDPTPTWMEWLAVGLAGVVLVSFRLHAFDLPLEADEGNYAYIGGRILEGDRLYVDVWDHQPFGVFALLAGAIALFGDAPAVFRWLATGFSLVTLLLIHAIVRRVGGRAAAVIAAVLFAIVSSDPGTGGEGCNREIFMNTCILAAWYLALRSRVRSRRSVFAAGCALAVGSSLKTIVAVHWVFLAVWVGIEAWRRATTPALIRSVLISLGLFALGPALLWIGAAAYFGATDRLGEFVDAVFTFNLSYSGGSEGLLARFGNFFAPPRHPFIFDSALPLWICAAAASIWLAVAGIVQRSATALAILLLLIGGYFAICLPSRFWPHYYYLLLPALVVAVSMSVGRLIQLLHEHNQVSRPLLILGGFVIGAAVPSAVLITEVRDYLAQPPFGITVKRYNSRDFWGRAQGENIRRVTDPGDEIFVFGNDTAIYYYAQRKCASRYTMITGLQEGMGGAEERRRILMTELEESPPRLIVVLFDEQPFDEWREFLQRYYGEPVGWDYHDHNRRPIMFVVARKDSPIEAIDWDWDRSAVGGWMLGDTR